MVVGGCGATTGLARYRWWGVAVPVVVAALVSALGLFPSSPAKAIVDDVEALAPAAQVRIFRNGVRNGLGTLVAPNWALTADHLVNHDDSTYTLRFGEINDSGDGQENLRTIDRIVPHPNRIDLAMVHFADPVPENTWIPDLATGPPDRLTPGHAYGWGEGEVLGRMSTVIIGPSDVAAYRLLRDIDARMVEGFTEDAPPMVTNARLDRGDSGGGTFVPWGVLAGVHVKDLIHEIRNESGNSQGIRHIATFEEPVWSYRDWIRSVINGEGPSGTSMTRTAGLTQAGDTSGRLLLAASAESNAESNLPMTLPPQTDHCDPGMTSCSVSEPTWMRGVLLGAGNYRGTALARCASSGSNSCSFDGVASADGASVRMPLGPSSAPTAAGTREVMVWCKTSSHFPDGSSPIQPVLRVSFTNQDTKESPDGYGWWDVTPDQIGTGTGQTLVSTDSLAPC
jgi:hypothetical protein